MLASLTVHEWAHAWTADRLGDPTARMLGRVTFNPIPHIDPIGTVILPLLALFSTGFLFGWAKPVPVNISRLRNPKRDFMIVAAAGPASNLVLAAIGALVLRAMGYTAMDSLIRFFVSINVLLAVFNMLPVPPLDGASAITAVLPERFGSLVRAVSANPAVSILGLFIAWQVFPQFARPLFAAVVRLVHPGDIYS